MAVPQLLVDGPADAAVTIALAHGAGSGMDHPSVSALAEGLAAEELRVARFEFPYMAARRIDGRRRPPDREPVLLDCWRSVVAALAPADRLVIAGRSMGGRLASLVADEAGVAGLVCVAYPFHPPRRPDRPRVAHLARLRTPTLILQGARDPYGRPDDVAEYPLSAAVRVHWLADADHDLLRPHRSGELLAALHEATSLAAEHARRCVAAVA